MIVLCADGNGIAAANGNGTDEKLNGRIETTGERSGHWTLGRMMMKIMALEVAMIFQCSLSPIQIENNVIHK